MRRFVAAPGWPVAEFGRRTSLASQFSSRDFEGRLINDAAAPRLIAEQRLDFLPQGFVAATSLGEESRPLV